MTPLPLRFRSPLLRRTMRAVQVIGIVVGLSTIGLAFAQPTFQPTPADVDIAVLRWQQTAMEKRLDRLDTLGTGIIAAVVLNLILSGLNLKKGR